MGTAIAERVLDAGYQLVVYNRTPEKAAALGARGAVVANTLADLVEEVDVVLTSLADDAALEAVAASVIPAARPGTVLVDMSTVSPATSARVAVLAEGASVPYLRAPVSGNPTVVRAGNLSVIVSGPRETLGGYADDDFIALYLHLRSASGLDAAAAPVSQMGDYPDQEVLR